MDARFRISRLSGWARYTVVLDGGDAATLGRGKSVEMEVASGTHTLQLVYRLGLGSPTETFKVRAGETAAFACHPPSFIAAIPRLVGVLLLRRGSWIGLDRTGRRPRPDGGSSEDQVELLKQIQAGRANQPGLPR